MPEDQYRKLRILHLSDLHERGPRAEAWAAGDEHDAGKLLLTDAQVGQLTTDAGGKPLGGLRLALVHHPLSELASVDKAARHRVAENVDLLLRGHLHESAVETVMDPTRVTRELAVGCLYEHDENSQSCQDRVGYCSVAVPFGASMVGR